MTNNNYNVQTDEQIARDILGILPDAPEEPNKQPTESPKVFMLPIRQLKSFQNHPFSKDKTPRSKERERREEYVLRLALLCRLRQPIVV